MISSLPEPQLLARQRDILVRRRVGMAWDQAESRLPDTGTGAVDEGQLPKVRVDRALVHELLGLVQDRLPLLAVELGRLLLEQLVDVGIVAVDVGATLDDEGLQTRGGVAEGAAGTLNDVLVGLLRVALEERRPLERPQLGA